MFLLEVPCIVAGAAPLLLFGLMWCICGPSCKEEEELPEGKRKPGFEKALDELMELGYVERDGKSIKLSTPVFETTFDNLIYFGDSGEARGEIMSYRYVKLP